MHIKSLEINGFKSYKNETKIAAFSPGQNTVVGRNGSGKSNVFRAIQFVLGEKQFSNLSHKERTELLHEGSGSNVVSAYVQIVFDNNDRRISLDSDEVVLRRTIGMKKDEWFLNSKHVTKNDVVSLLESAGFSRSNPYYIVQQGKVNSLCLMKDEQRLELLKEIAGTTIYEERRRNSEAILDDTKQKREKIEGVISYIEERLNELKDEKEELEAFRSLDKRKRALQYTLYDHEMQTAGQALDSIAMEHAQEASKTMAFSESLGDVREKIEKLDSDVSFLVKNERTSEREYGILEGECARLLKKRAAAELNYRDMTERKQVLVDQTNLHSGELDDIQSKLALTKSQLDKELNISNEHSKTIKANKHTLRLLEQRRQELEGKQGRSAHFSTQEARDKWLKDQIENVKSAITEKCESQQQLEASLSKEATQLMDVEKQVESLKTTLVAKEENIAEDVKNMNSLKRERDEAVEKRKTLWQTQQKAERELENSQQSVRRATKALHRSLPHQTAAGLKVLDDIVKDLGLDGKGKIFGPLYELIQPKDETYEVALEVAAGLQLTHVVVDSDETAAILMKELQRRKAGRLTFKPLAQILSLRSQLGNQDINDMETVDHDIVGLDEESQSKNAVPLIRYVEFPREVQAAVRAVLGKVLLCADAQVASTKRKELGINCVTLKGEEFNRRGAITGGFYDQGNSKLRAAQALSVANQELTKLENKKSSTRAEISETDQLVTQLVNKINKANSSQKYFLSQVDQIKQELSSYEKQLVEANAAKKTISASLDDCKEGLEELKAQIKGFEAELGTPLLDSLSAEEQKEMEDTRNNILELKRLQAKENEELLASRAKAKDLELEIEQNLTMRQNELLSAMGRKLHRSKHASKDPATQKGDRRSSKGRSKTSAASDEDAAEYDEDYLESSGFTQDATERTEMKQIDWISMKSEKLEKEFQAANERYEEAKSQLAALEKETATFRSRAAEARSQLEVLRKSEEEMSAELDESQERLDRLQTKRSMQLEKREASAQKIRELGSLSTEELRKVSTGPLSAARRTSKSLMNEIKKINEGLRKYDHVNKKALDQFVGFSDRREALLERKKELDKGEKSIAELITHLDHQKDQDIIRTFRQVSKNFRDVFSELVPNGKGELVMVASKGKSKGNGNTQGSNSVSTDDEGIDHRVEEFVGVSPRVCFTGKTNEAQLLMKQLSGGQRALVALTFIFAIQRCDPAPFYLFDEVDSALDSSYRTTVAALIRRQSESAQFIATTFRPELVQTANACFGVQFKGKISSIQPIKKDEAFLFVESTNTAGGSKDRRGVDSGQDKENTEESKAADDEAGKPAKKHRTTRRDSKQSTGTA